MVTAKKGITTWRKCKERCYKEYTTEFSWGKAHHLEVMAPGASKVENVTIIGNCLMAITFVIKLSTLDIFGVLGYTAKSVQTTTSIRLPLV